MGGSKDETPPRVVKSVPDNYSIKFNDKRIEIEFDEFIQLKNINQELIVSPPPEEKPVVRLKNKSIIIDLKGNLLDSTTYTLNFGQAIADNNESNILENYQYVFSTGNYIDSLGISGIILNAFDLKPTDDPITIMLYDDFRDSVPYKDIPMYIGKSTKTGYFEINNVKADTFKVFALKDKNYNLIYDLPDEEIGFLDTTFILSAELIREFLDSVKLLADTTAIDSLIAIKSDSLVIPPQDTLVQDSLTFPRRNKYSILLELFLFQEDKKPQYLLSSNRSNRKKLEFYFNRPLMDSMVIEPLNFTCDSNWYVLEEYISRDSLIYWIKDSLIYKYDTLKLHLEYLVTDSVFNYVPFNDTLKLIFSGDVEKSKKKEKTEPQKEDLKLSLSIGSGSIQDIFRAISINSEYPVDSIILSKVSLFKMKDTIEYTQEFTLRPDSIYSRKYWIEPTWEEIMNYRVFLEPYAFTDIYGITNDTINISFKTQSLDHYGKIVLLLSNLDQSILIQLMDDKDKIIRAIRRNEPGTTEFPWLEPGKYKLKVIFDINDNGKWDTGKYLQKIQPERVKLYTGEINVRTNWDLELNWNLTDEEVLSR